MDRTRIALLVVVIGLIVAVVITGIVHNDLNYTSTGSVLVGALLVLAGKKSAEDDDE